MSNRANVNVTRYEYEICHVDDIVWIPGGVNQFDPGAKTSSPLTQAMLVSIASSKISIDVSSSELHSFKRSLG